jgi:hypothetical protein
MKNPVKSIQNRQYLKYFFSRLNNFDKFINSKEVYFAKMMDKRAQAEGATGVVGGFTIYLIVGAVVLLLLIIFLLWKNKDLFSGVGIL